MSSPHPRSSLSRRWSARLSYASSARTTHSTFARLRCVVLDHACLLNVSDFVREPRSRLRRRVHRRNTPVAGRHQPLQGSGVSGRGCVARVALGPSLYVSAATWLCVSRSVCLGQRGAIRIARGRGDGSTCKASIASGRLTPPDALGHAEQVLFRTATSKEILLLCQMSA